MSYAPPSVRGRLRGGEVAVLAPPREVCLTVAVHRLMICTACDWLIGNLCQHPKQGCAPCKQGRQIAAAVKDPNFHCPEKLF